MATKQQIYKEITRERNYQDQKWGPVWEHTHDVGGWLTIMRCELREAEERWMKGTDYDALEEILHVVSVGVAAMEQHDIHDISKREAVEAAGGD